MAVNATNAANASNAAIAVNTAFVVTFFQSWHVRNTQIHAPNLSKTNCQTKRKQYQIHFKRFSIAEK